MISLMVPLRGRESSSDLALVFGFCKKSRSVIFIKAFLYSFKANAQRNDRISGLANFLIITESPSLLIRFKGLGFSPFGC